jgi:hypothetical protein
LYRTRKETILWLLLKNNILFNTGAKRYRLHEAKIKGVENNNGFLDDTENDLIALEWRTCSISVS